MIIRQKADMIKNVNVEGNVALAGGLGDMATSLGQGTGIVNNKLTLQMQLAELLHL